MSDSRSPQPSELVGPPVYVAPSAEDTNETNTVLLFPVPLEFLALEITFHGQGVAELEVKLKDPDGNELASGLRTDAKGKVTLPRRVPPGVYLCELAHQTCAEVCTVPSASEPFVVVLPVERAYAEVRERLEFAPAASAPSRRARR